MRFLAFVVLAGVCGSLSALDWGGSSENSISYSRSVDSKTPQTFLWGSTFRLWTLAKFGQDTSLLIKANVANSYQRVMGEDPSFKNTVSVALDTFAIENEWGRLGRSDFRDFSGTVLNTRLDGIQLAGSLAKVMFKAFTGTSATLFKSGSTIIISEDDVKDRQVLEDFRKPASLWAAPRVIAGAEATMSQLFADQTFRVGLLGQYDLRRHEASNGDKANTKPADRAGAPLSSAYSGVGWNGRIWGPLYGGVWTYGMLGTSLTAVGEPVKTTSKDKKKITEEFQTWRTSQIQAALGAADLTLLLPSLSYLLVNAGAQVGSWDPDGATPDKNAGKTAVSKKPSLYTGWVNISRTGGALIFNPQPANIASGHLVVSVKPWETVQLASSTFVSGRPTLADISEKGILPKSKDKYLGAESDVSVFWRAASDVGASLSFGAFLPNSRVFDRKLEYTLQASLNLSF